MEWLFIFLLIPLPMWSAMLQDAAPGNTTSKEESRNRQCIRLSEQEAHERFPGRFSEPSARGSFIATDALVCQTRVLTYGERANREEAILSELRQQSAGLAQAARTVHHVRQPKRWLVETYYPDNTMAAKITFATKTAMVERGMPVSDRVPTVAAGDVLVFSTMAVAAAFPTACARYAALGAIGENEALLAVVLIDERQTALHAGVCLAGEWQWLP